jgi:hypothetical protein
MTKRQLLSDHPPQGHAKYVRAGDPERIEQGCGIVSHIGDCEGPLRLVGAPDAPVVERDNPEVARKPFNLSFESITCAAKASNQQQRIALAVNFVVGVESGCSDFWQTTISLPVAQR